MTVKSYRVMTFKEYQKRQQQIFSGEC